MNSFRIIAPLCLLGTLLCLKRFRDFFILYALLLSQMFSVVIFFITARYRLVILPIMMIFSAYSIYWFYLKLKQKQLKNFIYGFSVFFVLFGLVNFGNPGIKAASFDATFEKHYNLGILFIEKGAWSDAIRELNLAADLEPLDYLTHFALGNAYCATKKTKLAIKEYKTTILMRPRFPDARFNLAHLYQDIRNFNEAEKEYREVLKLTPESLDAYFGLATLYKSWGKYKDAVINFKKISQLNPYYASSTNPLIEECIKLESSRNFSK